MCWVSGQSHLYLKGYITSSVSRRLYGYNANLACKIEKCPKYETHGTDEHGRKGPGVSQWSNVKVQVQSKFTLDSSGCLYAPGGTTTGPEVEHSSETTDLTVTLH